MLDVDTSRRGFNGNLVTLYKNRKDERNIKSIDRSIHVLSSSTFTGKKEVI